MTGKQRWSPGAIVELALDSNHCAYAQMLYEPEYAFFNCCGEPGKTPELSDLTSAGVIFRLWVMRRAHATGRWRKVWKADLSSELRTAVPRFIQDPIDPSSVALTYSGEERIPCTVDDCVGIERAAVWDPEHVEDRLRDHFAGRPNVWVESLKLKPTTGEGL